MTELAPELKCARRACPRQHDDCVHTQTGDRYCVGCARRINDANRQEPALVTIPSLETLAAARRARRYPPKEPS